MWRYCKQPNFVNFLSTVRNLCFHLPLSEPCQLDLNTWYHITVCKQMIIVKLE